MAVCGTGGWAGPVAGDPNNDSILSAVGVFGGIEVSWSYPGLNPYAVAHTRLYRNTINDFSTASYYQTVGTSFFFDATKEADILRSYWYWIEIVSIHGTVGDVIGPATATARPLIDDMIQLLTAQIDRGVLATSLKTKVDTIDQLGFDLDQEAQNRISEDSALMVLVDQVQTDNGATRAMIIDESNARAFDDSAFATNLNVAYAEIDEAKALVSTEELARVTQDTALSQQITTVQSELGDQIASVQTTTQTALTEQDGQITDLDGKVVDIGALYTTKLTVNGLVGGFGVYNDGTTVEAGFDVDLFWIGRTNLNKKKPFIISNDEVFIDTAAIQDASIANAKITKGNVFDLTIGDKIQSDNYLAGATGFQIKRDGTFDMNGGTFRGAVEFQSQPQGMQNLGLVAGQNLLSAGTTGEFSNSNIGGWDKQYFGGTGIPLASLDLDAGDVVSGGIDLKTTGDQRGKIYIRWMDAAGTYLSNDDTGFIDTAGVWGRLVIENVSVPANAKRVGFNLDDSNSATTGTITWRRPMFNRGSVALPYESPPARPSRQEVEVGATVGATPSELNTLTQAFYDAQSAQTSADDAQATADSKVVTFFQSTAPTGQTVGDLWLRSSDNRLHRWSGSAWIVTQDQQIDDALQAAGGAQATADGKIVTFTGDTIPSGQTLGDLWIKDSSRQVHRWDGASWIAVTASNVEDNATVGATAAQLNDISQALGDAADAQATADGKVVTFFQSTAPTAKATGDLWLRSSDNLLHRWSGSAWVATRDQQIDDALAAAAGAQATADGKIVTFTGNTAPTGQAVGDLWIKGSTRQVHRWSGASWVALTPANVADSADQTSLNWSYDTDRVAGTGASTVRDRANNANTRVNDWIRPNTTRIDGNKIFTGDAYVDTLQIQGNAVTIPEGIGGSINQTLTTSFATVGSWLTLSFPSNAVPGSILVTAVVTVYNGTSNNHVACEAKITSSVGTVTNYTGRTTVMNAGSATRHGQLTVTAEISGLSGTTVTIHLNALAANGGWATNAVEYSISAIGAKR